MFKRNFTFSACVLLFLIITSCSKEEGVGGNSVITGRVFARVYNNSFSQKIDSFYKPEVDVYLVYGDNSTYNDDFKTNMDGSYRFEYLRKGNYKVFVYSTDTTEGLGTGITPVVIDVNVQGNNKTVNVNDLVIIESMDYNDGNSSISGKLKINAYNKQYKTLLETYYKADKDVFISYLNDKSYFKNVKTYFNGTFYFGNLSKGTYLVYAVSDDINSFNSDVIMISDTITISESYQSVVIDDLIISETLDYNDGTSSITGKVLVFDFNAERTELIASYYSADEDVFITYDKDVFYFDDIKTGINGTFQFNNLIKGRYIVYALSDPQGRQLIPVLDTVEITEDYQQIVLDDLIIIK